MASTHAPAGATTHVTVTPAPRSQSTNYLAPLRHANQISNGNTRTSTFQERPAIEHYSGTPRLAGTLVRNSARSDPRKAKKPVSAEESSELETASVQAGQIPTQPGSISLTAVPQDTQGSPQANDFATPSAFSVLGVFGVLVVLALGIWGMVWFLGYWKTLNPSSWSAGEGTYSDDSQEGSPEVFSKIRREDANGNRPQEDIKAISRN